MTSPHIRPARHGDAEALAALDRTTWSPLHAVVPKPQPPYDPFFDSTHRPEDYLVADDGAGVPLGYVRIGLPTRLACNAHVRQIQGLVVADSARGRGIARALLRAAGEEARRQGATRLTLRVLGHNAPARTLYEAEGFVVEGVLPGEFYLDGRYVDDVFMGRSLIDPSRGPGRGREPGAASAG
ncbi:GNAT family N-acetyltransferase [Streptomyces sp. NPDC047928]|uniref:GNAT family N-acetyltransferase n=1 Tax=unclassified Streptomyces TaxID=2593676 RepID=UPI003720C5D1